MTTCYALTTDDEAKWRETLSADSHVMGSIEYCSVLERFTHAPARLFVLERDGVPIVAYPFLLRSVDELPFAGGVRHGLVDTVSPEYTGPVVLRPDLLADLREPVFAQEFGAWCRAEGVVAEFAHLDPWADASTLAPECVEVNRPISYQSLCNAWSGYHQAELPESFFPAYRTTPPGPAGDSRLERHVGLGGMPVSVEGVPPG